MTDLARARELAEGHDDLPRAAADVLREREAKDVARAAYRVLRDGWLVLDEHTKTPARVADRSPLEEELTPLRSSDGDGSPPPDLLKWAGRGSRPTLVD